MQKLLSVVVKDNDDKVFFSSLPSSSVIRVPSFPARASSTSLAPSLPKLPSDPDKANPDWENLINDYHHVMICALGISEPELPKMREPEKH